MVPDDAAYKGEVVQDDGAAEANGNVDPGVDVSFL
jgi:hypothetical protein